LCPSDTGQLSLAAAAKDQLVPIRTAFDLMGGAVSLYVLRNLYSPEPGCAVKRIGRDFFVLASWLRTQLTWDPAYMTARMAALAGQDDEPVTPAVVAA